MANKVISIENLYKQYHLGTIGTGTFYNDLKVWWAKQRGKPNPLAKVNEVDYGNRDGQAIWALQDISFDVNQGEALGIIGQNGAGKSTLLKILSRVTAPTSGVVKVKGRIASLLEVGTGFHPELTGRENIYLNGAILGMHRDEVNRKFDEIVAFSGVEKFIDTPVKRYSSGMYVRLAFAVAAHLEPEILVVDEVLAVGDADFQKKCLGKMSDVAGEGRTVLFVSHNMASIKALCKSAILLKQGKIQMIGSSEECIDSYINAAPVNQSPIWYPPTKSKKDNGIKLTEISITNKKGVPITNHPYDKPYFININYEVIEPISNAYMAFHLLDKDMNSMLFARDCDLDQNRLLRREPGKYQYNIEIPTPLLSPGIYRLTVHLIKQNTIIENVEFACTFELNNIGDSISENELPWKIWNGKLAIPLEWKEKSFNIME